MNTADKPLRCVITASTDGAVMGACLENAFFRSLVHSVVCDRACGAADVARQQGLPVLIFGEPGRDPFCGRLHAYLDEHQVDYVFSFYTCFYSASLRRAYADRLINLHPSLLPAFKGNDAWEYIAAYGARFTGSTVEFIHERMDEGKIILQTVCPWDDTQPEAVMRHRVFVQQCRALLQVARWLAERRVRTEECRVIVQGARFDSFEFSPALDFPEAIRFERPFPFGAKAGPGRDRSMTVV